MPQVKKNSRPTKLKRVKKTVPVKLNPHNYSYANISLLFKHKREDILEENEFNFLLAKAIQTVHGEIANGAEILKFKSLDSQNYKAIIKFKTVHYSRIVTSLLLFGEWKKGDCKIEVHKTAQTPCFLAF